MASNCVFYYSDQEGINVLDISAMSIVRTIRGGNYLISLSGSGSDIFTMWDTHTPRETTPNSEPFEVISTATGLVTQSDTPTLSFVTYAAMTGLHGYAAFTTADGTTVQVWNIASWTLVTTLTSPGGFGPMAFTRDGTQLMVAIGSRPGPTGTHLAFYDTSTWALITTIAVDSTGWIAVAPAGDVAVVLGLPTTRTERLSFITTSTHTVYAHHTRGPAPPPVITPNGNYLAIQSVSGIEIWTLSTATIFHSISTTHTGCPVAFSPTGNYLVTQRSTGSHPYTLAVRNTSTWAVTHTVITGVGIVVTAVAGLGATATVATWISFHLTSITPDHGVYSGGVMVTIKGSGFVSGVGWDTGTIVAITLTSTHPRYNSVPLRTVVVVDETTITGVMPEFRPTERIRTATVLIQTTHGHGSLAYHLDNVFITSLSPTSGPVTGGTTVTIHGGGFLYPDTPQTMIVHFGTDTATSVTPVSTAEMRVVSPAHVKGTVQVTVTVATTNTSNGKPYTYGPAATPTRQRPRDDHLGVGPARQRAGHAQPKSRQSSHRQGTRGTYS